jgi:signal transduction histidine kinase
VRGGLTRRTLLASVLLALVVGAAFAVLLSSVEQLRVLERRARQSEEVLVAANRLERLIIDLETGARGFLLTGQEEFLEPWVAARASFAEQGQELERLVAGDHDQRVRAQSITRAGESYIRDYSVPLVETARQDPPAARTVRATQEGKGRVDALRAQVDTFVETERGRTAARERAAEAAAQRATAAAAGGLVGSIVLVGLFAGYLTRAIVQPVRRVAAMAGRLAGGDLDARVPERDVAEIGVLEHSFNTMAVALQQNHAEVAASRARIVAAADQARRRIERDLHDGIQQRLVSLVLDLRAAETALPPGHPELRAELDRLAEGLAGALEELRETSRGIHPAILSEGGLQPALKALARRSIVPVELDLQVPTRLPEHVEVAAYYVVSEALANAAKHAQASAVHIQARTAVGELHMSVRDDGVGGAVVGQGSGLTGLADRIAALGGKMSVTSTTGQGTAILIDLPLRE